MKYYIEKRKLVLDFPYNAEVISAVKNLAIFKWNEDNDKHWKTTLGKIVGISESFNKFINDYGFESTEEDKDKLSKYLVLSDYSEDEVTQKLKPHLNLLDKPLLNNWNLMRHQKEAVVFGVENPKYLLADDMGTGKTISSLYTLLLWTKAFPEIRNIVICPATLQKNWQKEAKEIIGVDVDTYSYSKIPEEMPDNFTLIADEAHYLQSGKSQRTQNFLNLALHPKCLGVYLLSGTPMKNGRPINLYPLLKAIKHPISIDKTRYEQRYCDAKSTNFTRWDTSGSSNVAELRDKTKDSILRRTKAQCLDLPDKTVVLQSIEPSKAQINVFNEKITDLRISYQKRLDEGIITDTSRAIVELGQIRQSASSAKVESACELIDYLLDEGNSVVVFSVYKETCDTIAKKYNVTAFTGDLSLDRRDNVVQDFQNGKTKVFSGTIKAGGVGLTLTAASNLIMVDREWTPGDCEQAHDRIHRKGQKNHCVVTWLQYSIYDELVDAILMGKEKVISEFLNEDINEKTLSIEGSATKLLKAIMKEKKKRGN
jgi:SNF2 family DNA or RNA helicase